MVTTMEAVQDWLFDVPAVPKKERSKWQELSAMAETVAAVGPLVPLPVAAVLLDLSRQRVHQLVNEGTLRSWEFCGHKYVAGHDVRDFFELDRPEGTFGDLHAKEIWRRTRGGVKEGRKKGS